MPYSRATVENDMDCLKSKSGEGTRGESSEGVNGDYGSWKADSNPFANGAVSSALDVAVMRCEGDMGEFELAHVNEELFRLAHNRCHKVVLDLTRVDHVDYRGLRSLASRARLFRDAGGDLKLVGLSRYVATIFCAAGVDEEFDRYDSVEAAKTAFIDLPALVWARS